MVKYILLEIYYRCCYIVVVIFFVQCFTYFTQGFQLEFFSSLFVTNSQAGEFNYYNSLARFLQKKKQQNLALAPFGDFTPKEGKALKTEDQGAHHTHTTADMDAFAAAEVGYPLPFVFCPLGLWPSGPFERLAKQGKDLFSVKSDTVEPLKELSVSANIEQIYNKKENCLSTLSLLLLQKQGLYEQPTNGFVVQLNEAKTWSYLFMPCLNYFYSIELQFDKLIYLLFYTKLLYFICFIILHIYATMTPGLLKKQKYKLFLLLLKLLLVFFVVNIYLILILVSILEEYKLEQLDSELF